MVIEEIQKDDVQFWIANGLANRVEIGIWAFSTSNNVLNCSSNTFSYEKCIAIASLISFGYNEVDAAALVDHEIVYTSRYDPARGIEAPLNSDSVGQRLVGIYRLADASLWSVLADDDIGCVKPADLSQNYIVVATRGASVVDEAPADRVKHLLSRCDELGRCFATA